MRRPVLSYSSVPSRCAMSGTDFQVSYVLPMQCPVLTSGLLRSRCAMSGTDCWSPMLFYAMSGAERAYSDVRYCESFSYAIVSGTEIAISLRDQRGTRDPDHPRECWRCFQSPLLSYAFTPVVLCRHRYCPMQSPYRPMNAPLSSYAATNEFTSSVL
eukprot:619973-Rhodomonas_salina.2